MPEVHPTAVVEGGAERDTDVTIGPYAVTGERVRIRLHTRIGSHTVILQDIPLDLNAQGNRPQPFGLTVARLQRHGFSRETHQALKQTHRIVFESESKTSQALAQLEPEGSSLSEAQRFVDCIEWSQRGIGK